MRTFAWVAVFISSLFSVSALAATESPESIVADISDKTLVEIELAKSYFDEDPERFYTAIEGLILPVTDVDYIATSVMTRRYLKKASPQQIDGFTKVFSDSIIRFYGRALLLYDYQSLEVVGSRKTKKKGRVIVEQAFTSDDGTVVPIFYTMDYVSGTWKLRNITVKSFNFGKLFRDTFQRETQKRGGDIDKVIADWHQIVASVREKEDA